MRQTLRIDDLKHRALLKEEGDVLVVLNDLHRVWSEGTNPSKRHAASGVVTVLRGIVVVPVGLPPPSERKRVRLTDVAGPVCVADGARPVLNSGPRPYAAEVRFPVGETRRRRVQVGLCP